MKVKDEAPKRRRDTSRRDGAARRGRRAAAESVPSRDARRRTRPGQGTAREARAPRSGPETSPITRPVERPGRPKNTSQAKARAKARKAKAPKAIRPRLAERLATRLASIDLRPRTLLSRVPFVVLVIGALGLGLGLTLWLSTDSAERSYQLSHAREKNRMLQQQKEALERDVREAESAPALAEAARKQGMIPTRDTAHLVQDPSGNWVVVGTPKPADGVPPPPLNSKISDAPPPAPPPPALPPEVPVVVQPPPGAPPVPARSGPEALLRAPDGSSTVGGQHLPQTVPQLPGLPNGPLAGLTPGSVPIPGLPGPAAPAPAPGPAEVSIPLGGLPIPAPAPAPVAPSAEVPVLVQPGAALPQAPAIAGVVPQPAPAGAPLAPPAAVTPGAGR